MEKQNLELWSHSNFLFVLFVFAIRSAVNLHFFINREKQIFFKGVVPLPAASSTFPKSGSVCDCVQRIVFKLNDPDKLEK